MMGLSKSASLLVLLWAGRTWATPLFIESLFRRADSQCPPSKSFTSGNGLNFTNIVCDQNNPFNDAADPFVVSGFTDCMEHCSRFWGNGEGCFGVAYRASDNNCWLRNSTTSRLSNNKTVYVTTPKSDQGMFSSLVDLNQMKPLDTDCPEPDGTSVTLNGFNRQNYTVRCNKDIGGKYDTHWSYTFFPGPYQAFYHATSLDDCVQKCMGEHPLCRGVVYNPGLEGGYANCWPKTGFDSPVPPQGQLLKITHSATLDQIDLPGTDCMKDDVYTSKKDDSKNFAVHCGQANQGTNMTEVHTDDFPTCMEACAADKQGCTGVVYDSTMLGGFNNCYLQNTSSVFTDVATSMYGVLGAKRKNDSGSGSGSGPGSGSGSGSVSGSGSGSGSNSDSSSSGSKAWIAGAVIGPLLAIALVGGALWYLHRKKQGSAYPANNVHEVGDAHKGNAYAHLGTAPSTPPAYSRTANPTELGGDVDNQMVEMEGMATVKYAHKPGNGGPPASTTVHEMG